MKKSGKYFVCRGSTTSRVFMDQEDSHTPLLMISREAYHGTYDEIYIPKKDSLSVSRTRCSKSDEILVSFTHSLILHNP